MGRTIHRPYTSQLEGAVHKVQWGERRFQYTANYNNHCPEKVGRYNARYKYPVPKWWNKLMHTRPRRSAERVAINRLYRICDWDDGWLDCEVVFPLSKKPHQYYW